MAQKKFVNIGSWSGGLSDSDVIGIKNSYARGVGLNIHDNPNLLTVNQALAENSNGVVSELCNTAVHTTQNESFWFSSESGKIWKRTSAGVWSLTHTNTNGPCLCAKEWEDYLYYATDDDLGRYGPLSDNPTWDDSWQTLNSALFHPMEVQGLYLVIGNGSDIASVDDAEIFTANGTSVITFSSLPANQKIRCIRKFGGDVLIGTYSVDSTTPALLVRWDTVSTTYLSDPPDIPETSIQTIISQGTYAYIICGVRGKIMYYDGSSFIPFKNIAGDYSSSKYLSVLPESMCKFQGLTTFGVSNGAGNATLQGIYTIGQHDRNYPMALNLGYVVSSRETQGVSLGAMLVINEDLYVSWKGATSSGVDRIDWNNKCPVAFIEQLVMSGERSRAKVFKDFVITYKSKPANTDLALSVYKNHSSTANTITLRDKDEDDKLVGEEDIACGALQLRVDFTVSGNRAPIIESIYTTFEESETL